MRRPKRSEVALKSLAPFLSLLATIPDPRRAEGKIYQLSHMLLFSVFAVLSGANSYRAICTYVKAHRAGLNKAFEIKWKRAPSHTAIRYILQGLDPADVEMVFRESGQRGREIHRRGGGFEAIHAVANTADGQHQGGQDRGDADKLSFASRLCVGYPFRVTRSPEGHGACQIRGPV